MSDLPAACEPFGRCYMAEYLTDSRPTDAARDGQDCEYATERARRPLKDQIQNLRQRVADLESQLDASRRSSISVDPQGVREEPDESRPIIMATGSMSLNAEGNLVHAGSSSTFFWFMKKRAMENLPQAHPPTLSYLFPPHLPVTLSPSMHDRLINLAFQSQLEFGRIVDQTLFRADLEENHNSRTPSYSRFLHLIILGHGCRYIDDLQPSLSIDGTYENRGDIFISAAKSLVAAEMEAPCLSSIPAFALLAIYVGNMRQECAALPQQLKPDGFASNPVPHVVAHWAFICVHTIILHRPFFISLGDHASSDLSMDRCVTAASDILWLMRLSAVYGEARNCSAFYYAIFCAASVWILLAAGVDRRGSDQEQQARSNTGLANTKDTISFLNRAGKVWPSAIDSANSLRELLIEYTGITM
ncbi:hypothetical protein I350_06551 [Cryptococcus amylolentus CBS 6273]|uniref:Transcription factor domain-containing protein n=1 Tax=Cryptococcus amylolentus CBS 6273 TaxID=1296118 RepID=A0A1E3JLI4_9TREE|nr:hypothetical protein I350_06551 [Cryptococcus amylolentus CBS 6273]